MTRCREPARRHAVRPGVEGRKPPWSRVEQGREPLRPAGVADDDALLVAGDDLGDHSRPGAAPAVGDADRGSARVLREGGDIGSVEHGAPAVVELAGSPAGEGLSLRRASRSAGNSRSSAAVMTSRAQALTLTCRSSRSRARRSRSSGSMRIWNAYIRSMTYGTVARAGRVFCSQPKHHPTALAFSPSECRPCAINSDPNGDIHPACPVCHGSADLGAKRHRT